MIEKFSFRQNLKISCVLRGILWSIAITIILSIFFSLILQYTSLSETLLSAVSTFVFFSSMFLGSTIAVYSAEHKGLLYSTIISFSYYLLTLLFCVYLDYSLITISLLLKKTVLTIVSSLLGGIIGIGLVHH